MQRIGFIGASGMMGHGMAKNLLAQGWPLTLTVHRNAARVADLLAAGATRAASARALAEGSDIVLLCVTGSPQVEASVLGGEGLLVERGARLEHQVGHQAVGLQHRAFSVGVSVYR